MIKRPMTAVAMSVIAGILMSKINTPYFVIAMIVLTAASFGIVIYFHNRPAIRKKYIGNDKWGKAVFFVFLIPFLTAMAFFRGKQYDLHIEEEAKEYVKLWEKGSSEVILEGTVKKTLDTQGKTSLILSACSVRDVYEKTAAESGGVRVYIPEELYEEVNTVKPGNRVKVYGKLKIYEKATNDGQFDSFEFNAGKGIYAKVNAVELWITDERSKGLPVLAEKTKRHLQDTLNSLYTEKYSGVLSSMLLGDKSLMEDEERDLYRTAGISHILAVSGLHVSLFCMGIYKILEKIGTPKKVRIVTAFLALAIYIYISGMSISALRAGIMTSVLLLAQIIRRHYDMISSLCLAGTIILIICPGDLRNASFLLSFTAVLGVCIAVKLKAEKYTGLVITLMTQPIVLWFYFEMSVYGPIANMIVLPISSLLLMCGFLSVILGSFFLPLGGMFAGMTHILLTVNDITAKIVSSLPYSYICTGRPGLWQIVIYYLLTITGYVVLEKRQKAEAEKNSFEAKRNAVLLTFAWLIPIMALALLLIPQNNTSLAFLDVGQGDSIVLLSGRECIITDTGSSDKGEVGKYILTPYLKYHGVVRIDKAIVTHGDDDHINGIIQLLENMSVNTVDEYKKTHYDGRISIASLILPKVTTKSTGLLKLEKLAHEKNVAIEYAELGHTILSSDEKCKYTCLAPKNAKKSDNGTSLVYLLETPGLTVYLTGDGDVKEEKEYLLNTGNYKRNSAKTILKAGHHGSRTSSSLEFLEAIRPDAAVISCGRNNRYGHPHKEVIDNLNSICKEIRRTDLEGQIVFNIKG